MTAQWTYARPIDGADRISTHPEGSELVIEAVKTVRAGDPYLNGHFPGTTLYPAVFLLDGIRQAVGGELHRAPALGTHLGAADALGDWLELGQVVSVRVLRPMLEGDQLCLHIRVSAAGPGALRAALGCRRDDGTDVAKMTVELVRGGRS
ncbi:hotdog family protein [Amycolatopsis panacis]|uniref:hypothetical protein n=1 Tax=Amycolatopsis panacis TaxID=2340917 RepID=UPI0013146834|nr:hypothetical protein [Amycolatopsis panacis]